MAGAGLRLISCCAASSRACVAATLSWRLACGYRAGPAANLNTEVRSPQVRRRQALMLGSGTPNRASINRISDVWSNKPELT